MHRVQASHPSDRWRSLQELLRQADRGEELMPYHQEPEIPLGASSFLPVVRCPNCGAVPPLWKVGCQYQDCEECSDVEQSSCTRCGYSHGGANYWQ